MFSKIEIDGPILEQVKQYNYLGCELSLDGESDFDKKKINRCQRLCGTIRNHLKNRADTQMKFSEVVARPSLLYGSDTWVTTKRDMTRLEAAEIRFLRTYQHTGTHSLTNSMEQCPSSKANRFSASQNKFPTFYGTPRFITPFTSASHLSLSSARSIQYMPHTSNFLKIHLNIIIPSTLGFSK